MKNIFVLICMAVLIFSACSKKKDQMGLQMPNPASVNCYDKGGKLRILSSSEGQYGVCVFNDWTVCEEWAFFRNECKPGDCIMRCIKKKGKIGWYNCKGEFLFKDSCIPEPNI